MGRTHAVSTAHSGASMRRARASCQRGNGGAGKSSVTTRAARRAIAVNGPGSLAVRAR